MIKTWTANYFLYLNSEYCFDDRTFEKFHMFVTSSVYVYVGLLQKMVKLASIEIKSENTKNWLIFWNLLNQVISLLLSRHKKFNPIGWYIEEAVGVRKALKDIYGKEVTKHRTVSHEKHFSIENFKSTFQKKSKCVAIPLWYLTTKTLGPDNLSFGIKLI